MAEKIDGKIVPVFFVNASTLKETVTGDKDDFLDIINLSSIRTPMVISVASGDFKEVYTGTTNVIDVLKSVEAKTYIPFN